MLQLSPSIHHCGDRGSHIALNFVGPCAVRRFLVWVQGDQAFSGRFTRRPSPGAKAGDASGLRLVQSYQRLHSDEHNGIILGERGGDL